jgi:nucleoside-diphosphate-sugar epimerase
MLAAAFMMEIRAKLTGRAPLITRGLVRKFNHHWRIHSGKAVRDLGYSPKTVRQGIKSTLEWLNEENIVT